MVRLKKNKGRKIAVGDTLRHYDFVLDKNRLLVAMESGEIMEREFRLSGYFCIVTSENMTAQGRLSRCT